MKKIFALLLAAMLLFGIACSNPTVSETKPAATAEPAKTEAEPAKSDALPVPTSNLRMGTTGATGTYYIVGSAFSQTIAKFCPSIQINAEVTAGSVQNLQMIETGDLDLGMAIAYTIAQADQGGYSAFPDHVDVYALTAFNVGLNHFVVAANSDITSVKDLVGKRVSTCEPGGVQEIAPLALFEHYGIDPEKDLKTWARTSFADSMDALTDGRLDAVFYTAGAPVTRIVEETVSSGKAKVIPFNEDEIAAITTAIPYCFPSEVPANTYGNAEPIKTFGAANLLVCSAKLTDAEAYYIVKTLFDNIDDWINCNSSVSYMTVNTAMQGSPVAFHPGAVKYYEEKGAVH